MDSAGETQNAVAAPPAEWIEDTVRTRSDALLVAGSRTTRMMAVHITFCAAVVALTFVPAVAAALPVPPRALALVFAFISLAMLHSTFAFVRSGASSTWFVVGVVVDCIAICGGSLWLVYESGDGASFFWAIHALYLLGNFQVEWQRVHVPTAVLAPLVPVLGFATTGRTGEAFEAMMIGATVAFVFILLRRISGGAAREALRAEWWREQSAAREQELQRTRIARDLHDGVGAELTAILWRARGLAKGAPASPETADILAAAEKGLEELRSVVHGLDLAPARVDVLTAHLRERLARLAPSHVTLDVAAGGDVGHEIGGALRTHVERATIEAARNAFAHAAARTVRIVVESSTTNGVRVTVDDDGRGIAEDTARRSGLAHIESRARELGGTALVTTSPIGGTRVALELPASRA